MKQQSMWALILAVLVALAGTCTSGAYQLKKLGAEVEKIAAADTVPDDAPPIPIGITGGSVGTRFLIEGVRLVSSDTTVLAVLEDGWVEMRRPGRAVLTGIWPDGRAAAQEITVWQGEPADSL